jgi:hypothetical protein
VYRIAIRLHRHSVSFDPPQRVATLEIEHGQDGRILELMPADGEETDDGVAVLQRSPSSPSSSTGEQVGPGIPSPYLDRFPQVGEIDLANLPSDYKRTSGSNVTCFDFLPGERYVVTLVSDVTLQTVVIAD